MNKHFRLGRRSASAAPGNPKLSPGWHLTLTSKIILSLLALTALIAALALWQMEQGMNQLLLDLTRAQARVFIIGVEREIQTHAPGLETAALQEIIAHAVTHDMKELDFRVESLLVVNQQGKVIAHNEDYHIGEDYSDHTYLMRAITENEFVSPGGLVSHAGGREQSPAATIDVVAPLHLADHAPPSGAIEVELDVTQSVQILQSRYWDIRQSLLIRLGLLVGGLAILSLIALRYQVIARLEEMARVAVSISQGNLHARVRKMGRDEIGVLAATFNQMTDSLEETIAALKRTQLLAMTKLAELAERRDADTGAHLQRIPRYCQILADELRRDAQFANILDGDYMRSLIESSPLHDIGKVAVPDAVLLKPGRLTPEEFDIMKQHTVVGADILSGDDFLKMAHDIALSHHEKYDGSGYPNNLAAEAIPLAARIVALADVYDALTSKRVYKSAMAHEQACAIITGESGKHFDPRIVQVFLRRETDFRPVRQQLSD